jgi:hypothetical protein
VPARRRGKAVFDLAHVSLIHVTVHLLVGRVEIGPDDRTKAETNANISRDMPLPLLQIGGWAARILASSQSFLATRAIVENTLLAKQGGQIRFGFGVPIIS